MKHQTKCLIISRKPRKSENIFKTASLKFFDENNAHKTGAMPKEEIEQDNIETINFNGLNVQLYLEGNDIVINDLSEVDVEVDGNIINITGVQE